MGNEQNSGLEKIALGAGSGCIGLIVGMIFGPLLCVAAILVIAQPPNGVSASLEAPIQVEKGDQVEFVLNVTNNNEEIIQINGVDIGVDYLDGITVTSVIPAYDSYYAPEDPVEGAIQNYYFSIPVEPGQTVSITFVGKAADIGDYGGILDVCIGSGYSCISKVIRTVVE